MFNNTAQIRGPNGNKRVADGRDGGSALPRRELLQRGVAFAAIGALPSLLARSPDLEAASIGGVQLAEASEPIDFLAWEGYDLPGVMDEWKKKTGVEIRPTYIGNQNDIQAKIKAGGTGYDLITYYQAVKPLYAQLKILAPLDPSKIPNLKNLFPFFASTTGTFWREQDGTWIGVPLTWGANTLTYDASVFPTPPGSYDVLFDDAYKGKVAMADEAVTTYSLVARIHGFDAATMTADQFDVVKRWLSRLVAQTKGVSPSYGDVTTRLVSGEVTLAFPGWASINSFAKDAGKDTIRMTVPKEGGVSFTDIYAVPVSADNADTVHAWINETLVPEVNAAAQNYLVGGTPVAGAVQLLNPDVKALYPYDQLDGFFQNVPLSTSPPVESDKYVTLAQALEAWEEIKLGAQ